MRKIIALVGVILPVLSFCQTIPYNPNTKEIVYDSVYECNFSKDEIYNKARVWFADKISSVKNPLNTDDKEAGIIICKSNADYSTTKYEITRRKLDPKKVYGNVSFIIKIFIKDKKYRIAVETIEIPGIDLPDGVYLNIGKINWGVLYAAGVDKKYNLEKINELAEKKTFDERHSTIAGIISGLYQRLNIAINKKSDFDF